MRAARVVSFLIFLLLTPVALAQVPELPAGPPPTITVEIVAFTSPIVPRAGSQSTTGTATISCALAATSPQTGLPVLIEVTGPTWATVYVNPPSALIDPKTCTGPTVAIPLQLVVGARSTGAAGDTGDVTVTATASTPAGAQTGSATTPVTLGYLGAIDLKANATRQTLTSMGAGSVTLTVGNAGNARSILSFDVTGTDGIKADPLAPLTLDPAQKVDVVLHFRSTKEVGLEGRTDPLVVNASSKRDGSGDIGMFRKLEINVITKAPLPSVDEGKNAPGPAGALLAITVAAVALARTNRRR